MGKRRAQRADADGSSKRRRSQPQPPAASAPLYAADASVLVLGDGDFSFSKGLAAHRGTGRGVIATSFDSHARVRSKYENAADCISAVRRAGGAVLHGVDATKLHQLPANTKTLPAFFQFIVFNFPHSGQQRVHINRALLRDFFESARPRLLKSGEAHVTLKTRPPYSNWLVEDQAKDAGFVLKERQRFDARLFPGYRHRTTDPQAKKFEAELCVTYTFVVNRTKYPFDPNAVVSSPDSSQIEGDTGIETAKTRHDSSHSKRPNMSGDNQKHHQMKNPKRTMSLASSVQSSSKRPQRANIWRPWTPLHRRGGGQRFGM